jgi:hypothetical protein
LKAENYRHSNKNRFQDITHSESFQMTKTSQGYELIASHETQYNRQKQSDFEFDRFTSQLIFTDEKEFSANILLINPYGIDEKSIQLNHYQSFWHKFAVDFFLGPLLIA